MKENVNKQLSLSQRTRIEEMLNQRKRKFEIANELDKTQSTIAREINKHRILKPHNIYNTDNNYNCKYFINCKVCTGKCKIFQLIQNPNIVTTEMDTVYNNQAGPYIQTFIFENTSFMIGILHQSKTADSMSESLNKFQDKLSDAEYRNLFSVLLTDKGSEFAKPQQFEINTSTGEIRSKIFYCDPMQSSQKPHVENNHNFIREILQNVQDWSHLKQDKINLMFSHINSTPRENLGNKTPYEIFTFIYGEKLAEKLDIQKIEKDEVCTTPRLLK